MSKKVLLAGESWMSYTTHVKGFDSFYTSVYETGEKWLKAALEEGGYEVIQYAVIDLAVFPGQVLIPRLFSLQKEIPVLLQLFPQLHMLQELAKSCRHRGNGGSLCLKCLPQRPQRLQYPHAVLVHIRSVLCFQSGE